MSERTIPPQCPHGFPAGSVICTQCYSEMSHQIDHPVEPTCEERLRDEAAMLCLAALVGRETSSPEYCAAISEQAARVWIEARRKRKEG